MRTFFYAITRGYWKCDYYAWLVQPAERVCTGGYHYGSPVAGPFKTRREARTAQREIRRKSFRMNRARKVR